MLSDYLFNSSVRIDLVPLLIAVKVMKSWGSKFVNKIIILGVKSIFAVEQTSYYKLSGLRDVARL